jgi:hypothetical protein
MSLELDGRFQRDASALVQAKGIMMNKSFFLLFFIAALVSAVGLLVIGVSGVNGWILSAAVGVLGGVGVATGKADALMTLGVAAIGAVCGVISIIVAVLVILGVR